MCYLLYGLHPLTSGSPGLACCFIFTFTQIFIGIVYSGNKYHPFFAASFLASGAFLLSVHSTLPANSHEAVLKIMGNPVASGSLLSRVEDLSVVTSFRLGVILNLFGYAIWHFDQLCVREGKSRPEDYAYELEWVYWSHPVWHLSTAVGLSFLLLSILRAHVISNTLYQLSSTKQYTGREVTVFGRPITTPITCITRL